MAEVVRMPLLSDTMKEGIIVAWHKKVGDKIKADDVIAEVETDKATMEVMPYVEGTLLYIGVDKGKAAKVNDIIAIVGKEGENYQSLLDDKAAQSAPTAPASEAPPEAPAAKITSTTPPPTSKDASVVRMPLLSDTMKEGKIVSWLKQVGDTVKSDDVIAEVETDKATMEVMPYVDGTLLYIGVKAGEAAKVNDIIAIVGKAGTDIQPFLEAGNATATPPPSPPSADVATSAPDTKVSTTTAPAIESEDDRIKISPLARSMAKEKGIDIRQISGTGDGGRIIKRDLEHYRPQAAAVSSATATTSATNTFANTGLESYTDIPLSQMRRVIAQRLSESKFQAPHFYLRMSVKMDNAIIARKAMNEISPVKISFNDYIIKACAMALRKHPEVNSSWMGDFIRQNQHIHIGTAVAVDEGLIVPVVKFADQKSLSQIAQDAGMLIEKARNKKLQPPEFTGNTFTISNLGMMDIDEFTAIINPPDSCILAIGKIEATPVVEDGQMVIRQILRLTLSCDHRVVDGAVGSRFLQTLKAFLENPATMLV